MPTSSCGAGSLLAGRSCEEFTNDIAIQLAVCKRIEVLGESAGRIVRIDASVAERFPSLQLREAYAMRNRLTHGYNDVDLLILWNTARDFVPAMVAAASCLIEAREG